MIINIYYRPIIQTANGNGGNVSQAARNEADTDGQSTGRPEYPARLEQETAAEIAAIKAETAKFKAMAELESQRHAKAAKRPKKAKTNAKKGAI